MKQVRTQEAFNANAKFWFLILFPRLVTVRTSIMNTLALRQIAWVLMSMRFEHETLSSRANLAPAAGKITTPATMPLNFLSLNINFINK